MIIQKMKIEKLLPASYNPRKDLQPGDKEYEKIKRSIQEFGYVDPVIWNEQTGHVVGGHQRLKVLQEMGETEVDVSVVSLSEEKEKALNVALNKISGDWDDAKLAALLEGMSDADILLAGFDDDEFDTIDYSDLDRANEALSGAEDCNITITIPAKFEAQVKVWLADGFEKTAPGMGKGVLKKCGLL